MNFCITCQTSWAEFALLCLQIYCILQRLIRQNVNADVSIAFQFKNFIALKFLGIECTLSSEAVINKAAQTKSHDF